MKCTMSRLLVSLATVVACVVALDNGLARTPPMGWMSWQRFGCNIDCENDPKNCISENLYMEMADRMVADGYKDAGYQYVSIDDCWSEKERDPKTMRLVPDKERFPSGMKALADYIHSKGLKFGTYGDMGFSTCGGYPGNKFTMEVDAQTFAEWGVDSFKMDGCFTSLDDFHRGYPVMEFYLNKTGRPILLSCEWAAYQHDAKQKIDYAAISSVCNTCRNFGDIDDSWDSVTRIINYYATDDQNFTSVAGPGFFNDPDMIVVGSKGLSHSQEQVQMAMWAMFAAPLMLSADLREVTPESRAIMTNKAVIAINQDALGKQAKMVKTIDQTSIWLKPILPSGSYAIALCNLFYAHHGLHANFTLADLGVTGGQSYKLTEVFEGKDMGVFSSTSAFNIYVDVSSVFLGTLIPTSH